MLKKLDSMDQRFTDLEQKIIDPEIISNGPLYSKLLREHGSLTRSVHCYRKYKAVCEELTDTEAALGGDETDKEMLEIYREELPLLKEKKELHLQELIGLMVVDDEDANRNCIIEIRAGTGGDESSIFVVDLYKMYSNYVTRKGWKIEIMHRNESDVGLKEIAFSVTGKDVYQTLQFEGGAHRVQRVPETESKGRIHTSAATVVILPEVDDIEVEIKSDDLRVDTYGASGAGGQHVNKTDSAVRLTHLPTGIVVACQDERSQHKNRARAMRILRSRLYDRFEMERKAEEDSLRKSMVGTGERSEKIRTYNFPQSRITDHRINKSWFNIDEILNGELDEITSSLLNFYKTEKIKQFQISDKK